MPVTPRKTDEGPIWCLLPGMHGTAALFRPLLDVAPFAERCEIIEYPANEVAYEPLTTYVRSLLPEQPFIILAESFSGPIAVNIAAHPPANLLGLVLCATFLQNPRCSILRSAFPFLKPLLRALNPPTWILQRALTGCIGDEKLTTLIQIIMKSMDRETLIKRIESTLECDVRGIFLECKIPVLCINASDDLLVRNQIRVIPRRSLQIVDVSGPHLLLQTKPAEISEILYDFERRIYAYGTHRK